MRSHVKKFYSALSSLGTVVFVFAIVLIPALTTFKAFNVSADQNSHNKKDKIQSMAVRAVDKRQILPFNEPVISVNFDDGWESVYTDALPVLQSDGIPTTQYIIAGEFMNPAYMSLAQVKAMKNAGHEIGSHTMSHPDLTTLDENRLFYELSESKNLLSEVQPINDFAAPYSASDPTTLAFIKRLYRSNRLSDGAKSSSIEKDINTKANFNQYAITAFAVTRQTDVATIQRYIDYTKANNGWLILVYHQINGNPSDDYGVSKETFKKQMDLISKSNIRIATSGTVLNALGVGTKR
jgi:peptidoglycan/xylan/chitin deacetylase (PgdA/CDA1 family)